MILAGDLRPGMKIELDGAPYVVTDYQWVKPGKGGAFNRTKLKNMRTGSIVERTFRTEEKVEQAALEERRAQFMYRSGDEFHFMADVSEPSGKLDEVILESACSDKLMINERRLHDEDRGFTSSSYFRLYRTRTALTRRSRGGP